MFPFFKQWFPPNLPNLKHTVINSISQKELKKRTGIDSEVIWDSFDFDSKVNQIDSYSKHWRKDFGIESDDIVFLQPTRIVPRKRIELSIELVKKLKNPRAVLVIAGHVGDEGKEYEREIHRLAMSSKIRFLTIGEYVNSNRKLIRTNGQNKHKRHRIYTLWDCFVNADFVTYPTMVEGFGNQFVEAVYFNKPVIVTPYKVFKKDIAPLGFNIIAMPDKVTKEVVKKVNNLIENPNEIDDIVKTNFEIGKRYFSYDWVEKRLQKIINEMGLLRK
jgi:glycosyltransferase involved in cell wall biosynthesis